MVCSPTDAKLVDPFVVAIEAAGLTTLPYITRDDPGALRRSLTQSDCTVIFIGARDPADLPRLVSASRELDKPIIFVSLDGEIPTAPTSPGSQGVVIDARRDRAGAAQALVAKLAALKSAAVVAIYNVKGGVGKTTLAMNLSMYFYRQAGKKVLLVDLDPQTNLSTALVLPQIEKRRGGLAGIVERRARLDLLGPLQTAGRSTLGLLEAAMRSSSRPEHALDPAAYIHTIEQSKTGARFDIIPGDPQLHRLSLSTSASAIESMQDGFTRFISQCRTKYDFVFIDSGPSIGVLSKCALSASTHVLSPVTPNMFAIQGLSLLEDVAAADGAASEGRDHLIVINYAGRPDGHMVRLQIERSQFRDALFTAELRASETFSLRPWRVSDRSLAFLPAYEKWGEKISPARMSLQQVALEISRRVSSRRIAGQSRPPGNAEGSSR